MIAELQHLGQAPHGPLPNLREVKAYIKPQPQPLILFETSRRITF
jgi:hypothetical protein